MQQTQKQDVGLHGSVTSEAVTWAENSSAHGIGNIYRAPSRTRRALWMLIFAAGFVTMIVQSTSKIITYFSYPRDREVSVKYIEGDAALLALTACNNNQFRMFELLELIRKHELDDLWMEDKQTSNIDFFQLFSYQDQDQIKGVDYSFSTTVHPMGHQPDQLVSYSNMDYSIFNRFHHPDYGNCFTLIPNQPLAEGKDGGFMITFNVEPEEYPVWKNLWLDYFYFYSYPDIDFTENNNKFGMHVAVHPKYENPYVALSKGERFEVFTGQSADVAVEIRYTSVLADANDCAADGNSPEDFYKMEMETEYSTKTCEMTCTVKKMYSECGCFNTDDPDSDKYLVPADYEVCSDGCKLEGSTPQPLPCRCPHPCEQTSFILDVSSNDVDDFVFTDTILTELLRSYAFKNWQKNLPAGVLEEHMSIIDDLLADVYNLSYHEYFYPDTYDVDIDEVATYNKSYNFLDWANVLVYLPQLTYTRAVEVYTYDLGDLASDIGGLIGLYLGLSLIAVAETVEFIINLFLILATKCKMKRKVGEQDVENGASVREAWKTR